MLYSKSHYTKQGHITMYIIYIQIYILYVYVFIIGIKRHLRFQFSTFFMALKGTF